MNPKIKVMDGVSDGDVSVELRMNSHRDGPGAQEEITDDDVFKELINIVMDVFSNKPDKSVLTFELPAESDLSQAMPHNNVENISSTSDRPINKTEPPQSCPSFNRRRKIWTKTSNKQNHKKKKKKKKMQSSVVQTTPMPSSDLNKLSLMQQSKLCDGTKTSREHNNITDLSIGNRWQNANEKNVLITECPQNSHNSFVKVYNEIKQVLEAFEELNQHQDTTTMSFGELTYHLEEICSHIGAIRRSLNHSKTSDTKLTPDSSEGVQIKNKVGVKLIRIGAKISNKTSVQRVNDNKNVRNRKKYKQKIKINNTNLDEILKNYQRVKKEETVIVQNLLGKLGLKYDVIRPNRKIIGQNMNETPTDTTNYKDESRKIEHKRGSKGENAKQTEDHKDMISAQGQQSRMCGRLSELEIHRGTSEMRYARGGGVCCRVQSATKRLEYMHNQVEKKLNALIKRQKELSRSIIGKRRWSNEESRSDGFEQTEGSTKIRELTLQSYEGEKLDAMNGKIVSNKLPNGEDVTFENRSTSRPETQGVLSRENKVPNVSHRDVYLTKQQEYELVSAVSMENRTSKDQKVLKNISSSTALGDEFEENTMGPDEHQPASSQLYTTKENEGEIIEETLFTNPRSMDNKTTPRITFKTKKRAVHTPSCALS